MHTWLDIVAVALIVVGGLNWGLVAAARLDLVATLTGERFGQTNAASRLIYGLVGAAAIYGLIRLITRRPRLTERLVRVVTQLACPRPRAC